jgi:hypothetical protein
MPSWPSWSWFMHSYWSRSPPIAKFLAAGSTSSILVGENGVTWIWGKVRTAQEEAKTAPQVLQDLQGWNVNCISAGPASVGVGADESCILWGIAGGELGFGVHKKSSSQPAKNDNLEGFKTVQVSLGLQHTLFLVEDPDNSLEEKLNVAPASQYGSVFYHEESEPSGAGKRKGSTSGGAAAGKKKSKK